MRKPKNLSDLRDFYCSEYRPLYDRFVVEHGLPQELHAEVAAAFDHMMRSEFCDGDINREDFEKVVGHLKRATFDSFKMVFENGIRKKYDVFMNSRYANVEDGHFQPRITKMFNQAVTIARNARRLEHSNDSEDTDSWGRAFDEWKKIIPIADEFIEIENSEKILRAKRNSFIHLFWVILFNVALAVVSAVIGWLLQRIC